MSKLSNLVNGPRKSKRTYGHGLRVLRSDTRDQIIDDMGNTYMMQKLKSHERQKLVDGCIQFLRLKGFFDRHAEAATSHS